MPRPGSVPMMVVLALAVLAPALPSRPARAQAADATVAKARDKFVRGKRAFEAGDYALAIREFEAARAIRPSPLLEFNIGLAYEKLGRLDLAVASYETYLRQDPGAGNRADVEARLTDLRARMAREGTYGGGVAPPPPTETAPPPPPSAVPTAPPPEGGAPGPSSPPPAIYPPGEGTGAGPAAPGATGPAAPAVVPGAGSGAPATAPPTTGPSGPTDGPSPAPAAVVPPPRPRYGLGARLGAAASGGRGAQAFDGRAPVPRQGSILAAVVRAALPSPSLEAEASLIVESHAGTTSLGMLTLRGGLLWIGHPLRRLPALDLVLGGGIDVNLPSVDYRDQQDNRVQAAFGSAFGLWLDLATLRYTLGNRHELALHPLAIHWVAAFSSQGKQIQNPKTGNFEPTARVLDVDRGGAFLQYLNVAYTYRF